MDGKSEIVIKHEELDALYKKKDSENAIRKINEIYDPNREWNSQELPILLGRLNQIDKNVRFMDSLGNNLIAYLFTTVAVAAFGFAADTSGLPVWFVVFIWIAIVCVLFGILLLTYAFLSIKTSFGRVRHYLYKLECTKIENILSLIGSQTKTKEDI